MEEKYIGMVKFDDGELVTITFDNLDELDGYIDEMTPYLEKVLLKARFAFGDGHSDLEIIYAASNN